MLMKNVNRLIILLLATLYLLGPAHVTLAQDDNPPPTGEVTDDDVNAIAEQLYCPVCDNIPLDVCGTQACADWRDEIRRMLEQGHTEEEIKTYFADRYGRRVLATPDARGIDIVVWVLPPAGVLVGVVILVVVLRVWRWCSRSRCKLLQLAFQPGDVFRVKVIIL